MKLKFTKMQGAGNDFVVLDETRTRLNLTPTHYRFLADRHFGVGADQILTVLPSPAPGVDFEYKIHNADGGEVEQCGNGARCFLSFVHSSKLTDKPVVKVQTMNRLLELQWQGDGLVTVDMGVPEFAYAKIPFIPPGLPSAINDDWQALQLMLDGRSMDRGETYMTTVAVVSMGNPHAVLLVEDLDLADVAGLGPRVQRNTAFPQGVNVGFMQILGRSRIRLRVYERGAGETLACGTGACAAVVCGIRLGLLDERVDVQTRGGMLTVGWAGASTLPSYSAPVTMTGPATRVFDGEIELAETL